MSRLRLVAALVLGWRLSAATFPPLDWYNRKFNPATVDVRPVQGIRLE